MYMNGCLKKNLKWNYTIEHACTNEYNNDKHVINRTTSNMIIDLV